MTAHLLQVFDNPLDPEIRPVSFASEDVNGDLSVTRDLSVGRDLTVTRNAAVHGQLDVGNGITTPGAVSCDDVTSAGVARLTSIAIGVGTPSGTGAAIPDAAGGATVDAEARAAINALLSQLRGKGFIAP